MKLNVKKFMETEMGGELEETIRAWGKAIDERRKATPGIGNPDGKFSNWRSSSFMESNFSSQGQTNTSEYAARTRTYGL